MAKKLTILQIGERDWSQECPIPETMEWHYLTASQVQQFVQNIEDAKATDEEFQFSLAGLLITSPLEEDILEGLSDYVEAYTVFYEGDFNLVSGKQAGFFRRKMLRPLPEWTQGQVDKIVGLFADSLSPRPLDASRFKNFDISLSPDFTGQVSYRGFKQTIFQGDFGQDFQLLYDYRYNIGHGGKTIDFWLEYEKDGDLEIELQIDSLAGGYANIHQTYRFTETQMGGYVSIDPVEGVNYYAVSLFAKGSGSLSIGNLYWRKSRRGLGEFMLGGQRIADSHRQELIHYFHPGDMKPPLNVYFSGFRTAQGFEGYWMMKSMGAPFMLIGDPRLEGGSFYTGSDELEDQLIATIDAALDYLGFTSSDLNFSGLSMGTYGALYYASHFQPNAVIIGKPFTNLGDVAKGVTMQRPDEFETSMDMMRTISAYGGLEQEDVDWLNQKFWDKFLVPDFARTKFAIAYMNEDDYDRQAFSRLIETIGQKDIQIFGQGYTGRHNDNSRAVNNWFINEYHRILRDDFGRKIG